MLGSTKSRRAVQPIKRLMFEQADAAPTKRRKVLAKQTTGPAKKGVARAVKGRVSKPAAAKKAAVRKERKAKEKSPKRPKWEVKAHPSVKVLNADPFFSASSASSVPFVSTDNYSKLLITAVLNRNKKMLQSLLADQQKVSTICIARSADVPVTALSYAIRAQDTELVKMLFQAMKEESGRKRAARTQRILFQTSTGKYNVMSLGVPHIRKVQASRGSREGNNAFTVQEKEKGVGRNDGATYLWDMMEYGCSPDFYDTVETLLKASSVMIERKAFNNIYVSLRWGSRALAQRLLGKAVEDFQWGFGQLHYKALKAERAEELGNFRATSVTKKCHSNMLVTPLHCACVNPNEAILARLLAVFPEFSISDKQGWRPVHYAAACEGPGPLQLLLKRGVNPYEMTSLGFIALHVAAERGREKNVEILLRHAEDVKRKSSAKLSRQNSRASQRGDEDEDEPDLSGEASFGLGSINRPTRGSYMPLHLAVRRGHTAVVDTLLKFSPHLKVNAPLSASAERLTPLMLAARWGHMAIARLLLSAGGAPVVDCVDKMRRTALIHAARNGHTHVLSLLLAHGADPNHRDSSGNAVLHYAAAYGWHFAVQTLLDRGADPNAASEWKSTPLSVAFMNGHVGLVRLLLRQHNVDVNFVSDAGTTLIMMACRSRLQASLVEQVRTLVKELGAKCDLEDADGNTALHHLANNASGRPVLARPGEMDASLEVARLLMDGGCDPAALNSAGYNALNLALLSGNSALVKLLCSEGIVLSVPSEKHRSSVLHQFCQTYCYHDLDTIFQPLSSSVKNIAALKKMASLPDEKGLLPLHHLVSEYCRNTDRVKPGKTDHPKRKCAVDLLRFVIVDLQSDVNAVARNPEKEEKEKEEKEKPKENRSRFYTHGRGDWPAQARSEPLLLRSQEGKSSLLYLALADDDSQALELLQELSQERRIEWDLRFDGRTILHDAVRTGRVEDVKLLLRMGADVNAVSENEDVRQKGESPLMLAVKLVNVAMVELLLDHGADVTLVDDFLGNSALHFACCVENRTVDSEKLVRILVEHSPRNLVRQRNSQDRSPLHLAANFNKAGTNSSAEVEEYLLSKGADLMAVDVRGRVPLHYAFCKLGRHADATNIDPIELCQTLVSKQTVDVADVFGARALHYAAIRGATVCVQYLLQTAPAGCIDRLRRDGNSPLSLAVSSNHLNCSMVVVQMNANLKTDIHLPAPEERKKKDVWVWEPLRRKEPEVVSRRSLFEAVLRNQWQGLAYILADRLPNEGVTKEAIIHDCLRTNTYRLAMTLLRRWRDSGLRSGALFHTFVEHAPASGDASTQLRLAEILREQKMPANERDASGISPLIKALLRCNYHLARFFVESCRVDPSGRDGMGRTVLIATFFQRPDMTKELREWLRFLVDRGVSLNQLGDLPVHNPLWHLRVRPPRDYLSKAGTAGGVRISPLIDSIRNHCFETARALLLDFGADPNFSDSEGCSPLMHAAAVNDEKMVRLLLDHSYDGTDKPDVQKPGLSKQSSFTLFSGTKIVDQEEEEEEEEEEEDEEEEEEEEAEEEEDDDDEKSSVASSGSGGAQPSAEATPNDKKVNPVDGEIPENFPMVVPCSTVDLSRVDRHRRWTVLHHVVAPTQTGTFDNARLLRLLVHAGASLAHASELLSLASDRRARVIMKTVQYLINRPKRHWERLPDVPARTKDADRPRLPAHMDLDEDYKALLAKFEAQVAEKEKVETYKPSVDSRCQAKTGGELVLDDRCGRHFDITLHKIAVEHGLWGLYNFYKMQIVYQRTKKIYFLFTCWGRIGDSGLYQSTPFPELEAAVKEFDKVFRSKTGNKWLELDKFEEKARKYGLLDLDTSERKRATEKLPISLDSPRVSRLDPGVAKLLGILFDVKLLQEHKTTTRLSYQVPFGRLKRENLEKAAEVLKDVVTLAASLRERLSAFHRTDPADVMQKLKSDSGKLADLSNRYFKLVPQTSFAFEAIHPLLQEHDVSQQLDLLTRLLEMNLVGRLVLAAQARHAEVHPLDYIHAAIGCGVEPLTASSAEAQLLLQYAGDGVEHIYRLDRPGEERRCLSAKGPRKLLWHGTHPYNVASILRHGLLIAPPGIDRCGEVFGKGIYFADDFALSSRYAEAIGKEQRKFLFLCEVDVGDLAHDADSERVKGGRFVKMAGEPEVAGDFVMDDGCILPLGRAKKQRYYGAHNQYVIFEEERVRLRYLVQLAS